MGDTEESITIPETQSEEDITIPEKGSQENNTIPEGAVLSGSITSSQDSSFPTWIMIIIVTAAFILGLMVCLLLKNICRSSPVHVVEPTNEAKIASDEDKSNDETTVASDDQESLSGKNW